MDWLIELTLGQWAAWRLQTSLPRRNGLCRDCGILSLIAYAFSTRRSADRQTARTSADRDSKRDNWITRACEISVEA
jgi:hypothetical protein